ETAVAFGRIAGMSAGWLTNLFAFAPRPGDRRYVDAAPPRAVSDREGFAEFCSERVAGSPTALTRQQLPQRTRIQLQVAARRAGRRGQRLGDRLRAVQQGLEEQVVHLRKPEDGARQPIPILRADVGDVVIDGELGPVLEGFALVPRNELQEALVLESIEVEVVR